MHRVDEVRPGTRVKLRAPAAPLELTADTGTVVGPGEWGDYVVVHLDGPARYRNADGTVRELSEVIEDLENLVILETR